MGRVTTENDGNDGDDDTEPSGGEEQGGASSPMVVQIAAIPDFDPEPISG